MFIPSKRTLLVTTAVFTIAGSGAALAYWTQSGTGQGTATTGTTDVITVVQTSTIEGLFPGGPAVTLSGNFNNNNASPVFVNAVQATGVTVTTPASTCSASNFELGGTAPVGASVASGLGKGAWTGLTIKMLETNAPQNECKDVALKITYTSN